MNYADTTDNAPSLNVDPFETLLAEQLPHNAMALLRVYHQTIKVEMGTPEITMKEALELFDDGCGLEVMAQAAVRLRMAVSS